MDIEVISFSCASTLSDGGAQNAKHYHHVQRNVNQFANNLAFMD